MIPFLEYSYRRAVEKNVANDLRHKQMNGQLVKNMITFDEQYTVEKGMGLIEAYEEMLTIIPRPLRENDEHTNE